MRLRTFRRLDAIVDEYAALQAFVVGLKSKEQSCISVDGNEAELLLVSYDKETMENTDWLYPPSTVKDDIIRILERRSEDLLRIFEQECSTFIYSEQARELMTYEEKYKEFESFKYFASMRILGAKQTKYDTRSLGGGELPGCSMET